MACDEFDMQTVFFSKVGMELATRLALTLSLSDSEFNRQKPWGTWVTLESQSEVNIFLSMLKAQDSPNKALHSNRTALGFSFLSTY